MGKATKRRGRAPKKTQVTKLVAMLKKADSVVAANLSSLRVAAVTKLRADLRQQGGGMMVAKNRLVKRALQEAGYPSLDSILKGPTALMIGVGDPSTPAKKILELMKENESIVIKGGVLEGVVLDRKGVEFLATMPGRPELLGRLVGSINAPIQKLVFALNQTRSKVVYAIDAYRRQLESAGS